MLNTKWWKRFHLGFLFCTSNLVRRRVQVRSSLLISKNTIDSLVTLLESYYVLDGCIYKCPNLQTLISHRILSSLHYLKSATDYADEWLKFDQTLSRYKIKNDAVEATAAEDTDMDKVQLDGISRDKIDFVTQINAQFMNLPWENKNNFLCASSTLKILFIGV